jgi:hypothetical protein
MECHELRNDQRVPGFLGAVPDPDTRDLLTGRGKAFNAGMDMKIF